MSTHLVTGAVLLVTVAGAGVAQSCRQEWTVSGLSRVIGEAYYDEQVYRACAIQGNELRPALRKAVRAKSGVGSPAWAAQVCLAKLDDDTAIAQLRDELKERFNEAAISKLARAGTTRSIALLMDYVVQHQNDRSIVVDLGDAGYDPIYHIFLDVARFVPDAPDPYGIDSLRFPRLWSEWWRQHQGGEPFRPRLEDEFPSDPLKRCLARKAEWGFPQAILDLDEIDNDSVPTHFFRVVAGAEAKPVASINTVAGIAQVVLAKRGDQHEVEKIQAELNTSQYNEAIGKLQIIGGLSSVGMLVKSMDLTNFLAANRSRLSPESFLSEGRRYLTAVLTALDQMVKQLPVPPPAVPTHDDVERWMKWWASGPTADALVPGRRHSSE
jgi:hypothetical protein